MARFSEVQAWVKSGLRAVHCRMMSTPILMLTAETLMGSTLHTHANITPADVNTLKPEFSKNSRIDPKRPKRSETSSKSPTLSYFIRLNLSISGSSFSTFLCLGILVRIRLKLGISMPTTRAGIGSSSSVG
jgi:hypothetical protein